MLALKLRVLSTWKRYLADCARFLGVWVLNIGWTKWGIYNGVIRRAYNTLIFWYNAFFALISFHHSKSSVDYVIVLKRTFLRMACHMRTLYSAKQSFALSQYGNMVCNAPLRICVYPVSYYNKLKQVCSNYIMREEKGQCLLLLLSCCCYIFSFINLYQYQMFVYLIDTLS